MGSKREETADDLNLVPIMNLVTILIPFLLMAAEFVSIAVIDSTLPAIGAPSEATDQKDPDKKPLNLSVLITQKGYAVKGSAPLIAERNAAAGEGQVTIPCREDGCPVADSYDIKELRGLLASIKDDYEEEHNVILVPSGTTSYEVLVKTMDATRDFPSSTVGEPARELFPFVVIAGGAG